MCVKVVRVNSDCFGFDQRGRWVVDGKGKNARLAKCWCCGLRGETDKTERKKKK